jgi:hypothetical protein
MPGDLLSRSLIEIAADLRAKRLTARELVETAIARHERFGERLHAYSLWAPEQARVVPEAVGPLQGLPVSIKDLFAASGYPCFAGSSGGCRWNLGNETGLWSRCCDGSSGSADDHALTKAGLRCVHLVETAEQGLRMGDVRSSSPSVASSKGVASER